MTSRKQLPDSPTERELFEFERYKFLEEKSLKSKEIDQKHKRENIGFLKSPMFIAILGGIITITVNSIANYHSTKNTIELDRQKLQADLIKKYLEPTDTKTRKNNLNFLVQTGLIPQYQAQIAQYLVNNPDAIPQTPSIASATALTDGYSFGAPNILTSDILARLEKIRKALVVVRSRQGSTDWMKCTGVLTAANTVVTMGYCAETNMGLGAASSQNLKVEIAKGAPSIAVIGVKKIGGGISSGSLAVLTLAELATSKGSLEIDRTQPSVGQKLILPFLGATPDDFFASVDSDCRITDLKGKDEIAYKCDGYTGSGGAPIISLATGKILGIHSMVTQEARWGIRLNAKDVAN